MCENCHGTNNVEESTVLKTAAGPMLTCDDCEHEAVLLETDRLSGTL